MVWLNNRHINHPAPPGHFGGAMCTCSRCTGDPNAPPPEDDAADIAAMMKMVDADIEAGNLVEPDPELLAQARELTEGVKDED